MNRSQFRLLFFCVSILTITINTNSATAQTDVGYRLHLPTLPPQVTSLWVGEIKVFMDLNAKSQALVVGHYERSDRPGRHGYVYDHFGLIDPDSTYADSDPASPIYDPVTDNEPYPQRFWDIQELVGPNPPAWALDRVESKFFDVNGSGRICGYLRKSDGTGYVGMYLDLNSEMVELESLPVISSGNTDRVGLCVNEIGQFLILGYSNGSWGDVATYDPLTGKLISIPIQFSDYDRLAFNSSLQFLAELPDHSTVRHQVMDLDNDGISDTSNGQTEIFSDVIRPANGINESGQFAGKIIVQVRRNRTEPFATRIGADGAVEWQYDYSPAYAYYPATEINNSGDVANPSLTGGNYYGGYYFHEGDPGLNGDENVYFVEDLIIAETDPDQFYKNASFLSDRDSTGFGWLAGVRTGSLFLLIPELPTGISVTPTSGLITTEAGGTAAFDVVLDTQPAADVSIGISSSNPLEGISDTTGLTFTPANWDIPQTVTVTGEDDPFEDGDQDYTIITAPATSTDTDYHGLNANDVSVTNLNNDGPPGGGSEMYSSADPPLAIPDNNAGGVASNILAGDHVITNLTVSVDITHPRPSDLEVYLIGPDNGPPVQLFNFSGDNNVADFNGTSSLGLWTLEVYDTKKKKTGTLNSWSVTVDY